MSMLAKQKQLYRSADFGNLCIYEQSNAIVQRSYEKSLNLEETPGLLIINKKKPRELNKNKSMHVTNVHGSAEGQDMLKLVESIENEKKEKQNQKRKKNSKRIKKRNCFTDVRQNKSVAVFVQQRVIRSPQLVLKSRNQHAAKLLVIDCNSHSNTSQKKKEI